MAALAARSAAAAQDQDRPQRRHGVRRSYGPGGGVGGTGLTAAELKQIGEMVDIGSFNAATKGMALTIGTQQALSSTISTFACISSRESTSASST